MKSRTLLVMLALALQVAGCKAADGEACEEGDDCSSSRCFSGYCAGSECECDSSRCERASSDDCETGWVCQFVDPDAVSDFFGADGDNYCEATCAACPPSQHCEEGASAKDPCLSGPPP